MGTRVPPTNQGRQGQKVTPRAARFGCRYRTTSQDPDPLTLLNTAVGVSSLAYDLLKAAFYGSQLPALPEDHSRRERLRKGLARWGNEAHTLRPSLLCLRDLLEQSGVNLTTPAAELKIVLSETEVDAYYDGLSDLYRSAARISRATGRLLKDFSREGFWIPRSVDRLYKDWEALSIKARAAASALNSLDPPTVSLAVGLSVCMRAIETLEELESFLRAIYYSAD